MEVGLKEAALRLTLTSDLHEEALSLMGLIDFTATKLKEVGGGHLEYFFMEKPRCMRDSERSGGIPIKGFN